MKNIAKNIPANTIKNIPSRDLIYKGNTGNGFFIDGSIVSTNLPVTITEATTATTVTSAISASIAGNYETYILGQTIYGAVSSSINVIDTRTLPFGYTSSLSFGGSAINLIASSSISNYLFVGDSRSLIAIDALALSSVQIYTNVFPTSINFSKSDPSLFLTIDQYPVNVINIVNTTTAANNTIAVGSKLTYTAVSKNGTYICALDSANRCAYIIDGTLHTILETISVGINPTFAAFTNDEAFAYVVNTGSSTITIIDVAQLKAIRTINYNLNKPTSIAFSKDNKFAYVSNSGGSASIFNIAKNYAFEKPINVFGSVYVDVSPDGLYAFIASGNAADGVVIVSTITNSIVQKISKTNFVPQKIVFNSKTTFSNLPSFVFTTLSAVSSTVQQTAAYNLISAVPQSATPSCDLPCNFVDGVVCDPYTYEQIVKFVPLTTLSGSFIGYPTYDKTYSYCYFILNFNSKTNAIYSFNFNNLNLHTANFIPSFDGSYNTSDLNIMGCSIGTNSIYVLCYQANIQKYFVQVLYKDTLLLQSTVVLNLNTSSQTSLPLTNTSNNIFEGSIITLDEKSNRLFYKTDTYYIYIDLYTGNVSDMPALQAANTLADNVTNNTYSPNYIKFDDVNSNIWSYQVYTKTYNSFFSYLSSNVSSYSSIVSALSSKYNTNSSNANGFDKVLPNRYFGFAYIAPFCFNAPVSGYYLFSVGDTNLNSNKYVFVDNQLVSNVQNLSGGTRVSPTTTSISLSAGLHNIVVYSLYNSNSSVNCDLNLNVKIKSDAQDIFENLIQTNQTTFDYLSSIDTNANPLFLPGYILTPINDGNSYTNFNGNSAIPGFFTSDTITNWNTMITLQENNTLNSLFARFVPLWGQQLGSFPITNPTNTGITSYYLYEDGFRSFLFGYANNGGINDWLFRKNLKTNNTVTAVVNFKNGSKYGSETTFSQSTSSYLAWGNYTKIPWRYLLQPDSFYTNTNNILTVDLDYLSDYSLYQGSDDFANYLYLLDYQKYICSPSNTTDFIGQDILNLNFNYSSLNNQAYTGIYFYGKIPNMFDASDLIVTPTLSSTIPKTSELYFVDPNTNVEMDLNVPCPYILTNSNSGQISYNYFSRTTTSTLFYSTWPTYKQIKELYSYVTNINCHKLGDFSYKNTIQFFNITNNTWINNIELINPVTLSFSAFKNSLYVHDYVLYFQSRAVYYPAILKIDPITGSLVNTSVVTNFYTFNPDLTSLIPLYSNEQLNFSKDSRNLTPFSYTGFLDPAEKYLLSDNSLIFNINSNNAIIVGDTSAPSASSIREIGYIDSVVYDGVQFLSFNDFPVYSGSEQITNFSTVRKLDSTRQISIVNAFAGSPYATTFWAGNPKYRFIKVKTTRGKTYIFGYSYLGSNCILRQDVDTNTFTVVGYMNNNYLVANKTAICDFSNSTIDRLIWSNSSSSASLSADWRLLIQPDEHYNYINSVLTLRNNETKNYDIFTNGSSLANKILTYTHVSGANLQPVPTLTPTPTPAPTPTPTPKPTVQYTPLTSTSVVLSTISNNSYYPFLPYPFASSELITNYLTVSAVERNNINRGPRVTFNTLASLISSVPDVRGFDVSVVNVSASDGNYYTFVRSYNGDDWVLRRNNNTNTWIGIIYLYEGGILGESTYGFTNSTNTYLEIGSSTKTITNWTLLLQPDSYYTNVGNVIYRSN